MEVQLSDSSKSLTHNLTSNFVHHNLPRLVYAAVVTMMMVRFHSLVAFKRSLVARKLTSVIDITGNSVYCAVPSSLQPLDDAIVDMLASNSDARPKLRQALVLDKAMNFAHVLNVYEELRYDSHFLSGKSVQESLSRLETQQQKGL